MTKQSILNQKNVDCHEAKASRNDGFTLAEVLITLVIIGVIAAITVPNMIVNVQKQQTTAKLKKFYSIMTQAIMRWEKEEGLEQGKIKFIYTGDRINDFKDWYDSSLAKYLSSIDKTVVTNGNSRYTIKLSDGSGFNGYVSSENHIHIFYCTEAKYCAPESYDGKHTFLFEIINGKFTSYCDSVKTSREALLDSCNNERSKNGDCHCCTALIMKDGWEIKEDYPYIH